MRTNLRELLDREHVDHEHVAPGEVRRERREHTLERDDADGDEQHVERRPREERDRVAQRHVRLRAELSGARRVVRARRDDDIVVRHEGLCEELAERAKADDADAQPPRAEQLLFARAHQLEL